MVRRFLSFSSHRKRVLLLKVSFTIVSCVGLLIWWNRELFSSKEIFLPRSGYQKAEFPIHQLPEHGKELGDEFLVRVLQEHKYVEVDLQARGTLERDDYDEEIKTDLKGTMWNLGARGERGSVPESQAGVAEEVLKKEAFNKVLSDLIPLNRTVPDTREPACRGISYEKDLPDVTVVIIYTDEAYSSLLRTIHSVVNRSPPELLREIVLVDDYSKKKELKGKLERYLSKKFTPGKVRLLRLNSRAGLIRARMIGAHVAKGKVLVFLDAHCETTESWLEPLLTRIHEDNRAVVCPIIDVIDDKTLEYSQGNGAFFQIGGFTWSGHFTWINIPPYEAARKKAHHSPTRSPTMAGGLFAIDKEFFWHIGSYDSDMQLWGGENLEMSFRVWQCGGFVEIAPCSRVGHIFRSFHPYTFPGNVDSHGLNTARLVEVWMDEFKEIFYSHRKELKTADFGDVSKRVALRDRLQCKSFRWYLDNVYREKFRLSYGSKAWGQVKNQRKKRCLDNMAHSDSEEYKLSVYPCHPVLYPSQTFFVSDGSELRRETECAIADDATSSVSMVNCDSARGGDKWSFRDGQLVHESTGRCLTIGTGETDEVSLDTCVSSLNQKWTIDPLKTNERSL